MKVVLQVPFDLTTVQALGPAYERAIKDAMASAAVRIRKEAKALMPRDTGELQRRFYVGPRADAMELVWGAPYAEFVDLGTPPHKIRPRDPNGFLKFPGTNAWTGRTIYAKEVDHPGQVGQLYRLPVGQLALQIMQEELVKAFNKVRLGP